MSGMICAHVYQQSTRCSHTLLLVFLGIAVAAQQTVAAKGHTRVPSSTD